MKKIYTILITALCYINAFSQTPNYSWAKNAGAVSADDGKSVTTDSNGNVIVTGYFKSPTITFGNIVLTNSYSGGLLSDIFVVKYDPLGNVLWAKQAGGILGNDEGSGITVDLNGNVFVTGYFQSDSLVFENTILLNAGNGNDDVFIVKYDPSGNVLWAKSAGGPLGDFGSDLTTDANGNAYLSGYFWSSSITFGNSTLNNSGGADALVVKYDASGNVVWARGFGGNFNDRVFGIGVDAGGNISVAGSFESASLTIGTYTFTNPNPGTSDVLIAQYDPAGAINWAKGIGGGSWDLAYAAAVDLNGNVLITGEFSSPAITFGSTTLVNTGGGAPDIFAVKYDAGGSLVWAKRAGGTSGERGYAITTDAGGNVFITGHCESPSITFGTTTLNNSVLFIVKYDAAGTVLWAKDASGFAIGYGIAVDTGGNVFVTGYIYYASVTFGNTLLTNGGNDDMFIVKLSTGNVSVGEIEEKTTIPEIILSPNPFTSVITINFAEEQKNITVRITDSEGKEIKGQLTTDNRKCDLDIADAASGVYFMEIKTESPGKNGRPQLVNKTIVKQ